jgi:hypothetical protein
MPPTHKKFLAGNLLALAKCKLEHDISQYKDVFGSMFFFIFNSVWLYNVQSNKKYKIIREVLRF